MIELFCIFVVDFMRVCSNYLAMNKNHGIVAVGQLNWVSSITFRIIERMAKSICANIQLSKALARSDTKETGYGSDRLCLSLSLSSPRSDRALTTPNALDNSLCIISTVTSIRTSIYASHSIRYALVRWLIWVTVRCKSAHISDNHRSLFFSFIPCFVLHCILAKYI